MSLEKPVHVAEFDYTDTARLNLYVSALKKQRSAIAAWTEIEDKLLLLSEMSNQQERSIAIAELEQLRTDAVQALEISESSIRDLLPTPPPAPQVEQTLPE